MNVSTNACRWSFRLISSLRNRSSQNRMNSSVTFGFASFSSAMRASSSRLVSSSCSNDYPAELVKAKFLKLDSHHIEFVMDCLRDNTTKVRNIKQYLRAMLFNAPSTINSYYASLVAHDMAQPDWGRPPNT